MNKKLVIAGISVALILSVVAVFKVTDRQVDKVVTIPKVSALSGPDISSTYLSVNGVKHVYQRQTMNQATTTICAMPAPSEATSTLVYASAIFSVSSTTASTITLAKDTTLYGTSTPLTIAAISANAQGMVMASSTPLLSTGLINGLVFATSTNFVVGMAGGIGTFSPVGTCITEWIVSQ